MILPPGEIKIKRKRSDEPVDLLHIHEPIGKKRRCASEFVFYRQASTNLINDAKPINSNTGLNELLSASPSPDTIHQSDKNTKNASKSKKFTKLRQFHIYHSATSSEAKNTLSSLSRKRKAETIFVERKACVPPNFRPYDKPVSPLSISSKLAQTQTTRPRKIPGLAARNSTPVKTPSPAPLRNVCLPSGITIPWDVTSHELVTQMQAYTLAEINKNVAIPEAERSLPKPSSQYPLSSKTTNGNKATRFKPKMPALRYKDRQQNKEEKALSRDPENEVSESSEEENEDWVVETYLRMPVAALEGVQTNETTQYGYLVLDSPAEIEEFYVDDTDSENEDEWDEDENAENHYSADYPDEEVASDDEFDLNAYNYTFDLDEFEVDPSSEDDYGEIRYPWMKKPWLGSRDLIDVNDYEEDNDS